MFWQGHIFTLFRCIYLKFFPSEIKQLTWILHKNLKGGGGGGGGGVQAYHFGKKDFKLGIGREGQDTSRHFEGGFGSIRAILPM